MNRTESLINKLNDTNNPALRELYGNDISELRKNSERYNNLLKQFTDLFGEKEVQFYTSPGRTEIGGNHTDHNWGRVLAGAVNLDNVCVAAPNGTDIIRIVSEGYPSFEVDLSNLGPDESERFTSAALVMGICSRFRDLGFAVGGFDACIDGGVP